MKTIERRFIEELAPLYPADEAREMARNVLMDVMGWSSSILILQTYRGPLSLSEEEGVKLEEMLCRLKKGEPLQYIEGEMPFMGLNFNVGPGCLIPRPETAELIDWVTDDCKTEDGPALLDVGTGSGCIAINLAYALPKAKVSAVDVSTDALRIATENAAKNNVEVSFSLLDILKEEPCGMFDAIVSNPPYICEQEKEGMRKNVLDFEPHLALFVPDSDPLLFYRRIAELGLKYLNAAGRLYFEINERFGQETVLMLQGLGYTDVQLRTDFCGKDRMVRATKA